MTRRIPERGELWYADFGETLGHEQAGFRPMLVISTDGMNSSMLELLIGVPLTTRLRPSPARVRVAGNADGRLRASDILCDQIRTLSTQRLGVRLGRVDHVTLQAVEYRMRFLLGL